MLTVSKTFRFDAGHRLLGHEGKCRHLHGHSYFATVTVEDPLNGKDGIGRVIDFSVIKDLVGAWIDDKFDHGTIVNFGDKTLINFLQDEYQKFYPMACNPTAENIAIEIHNHARRVLEPLGLRVVQVTVQETPTCSAAYREDRPVTDNY